jgi:thioesterase domain-containing protein/acyl carrier protein
MSLHARVQPLAVPPRPGEFEVYPASLAQRRLWFLNQLQAPTAAYNVHVGLWLYGPLNVEALRDSLQEIVNRHEALRTSFALEGGELFQRVIRTYSVTLPMTDFADLSEPYPPAYEFAKREVETPFDLDKGPLFRAQILRIAPEEHVFLCTMHHTITDAWSMQVFTKELAVLYEALSNGKTPALPELTIQYGDYSEWQGQLLGTEDAQKQLLYWKDNLEGALAVLELPQDNPRPAEQTLQGASQTFAVPGEIMADVLSLAKQHRVTPFMFLLSVFKILLHRYSGESDVLVGVPVAGRTCVEIEALIGFFVETLVLRDDLSGNPRFVDLLAQVHETTLGALANPDIPFEKVVEALRPERNLSCNPVFQIMFSVIKSAIRSHDFGNVVAYPYVVNSSTSILDLSATFIEDSDEKWWLQIDFNTSLFRVERIASMVKNYIQLLSCISADLNVRINDIPLPGVLQPKVTEPKPRKRSGQSAIKRGGRTGLPARPAEGQPAADGEQALLIEIWKDVLGAQEIDIHDNFFDIGGHSLLATRLTAQIQNATGRTIPVSAIFRAPTIETLASLLRNDAASKPDPVIMQLSQGDNGVPFFAVAAPGVDSLGYALLARHLGNQQSMYKLQNPGPGVWGRPFEREELGMVAEQYVSAMRAVQPHGPFCLVGMCDGVLIAQEMILQLESLGEEVALFAILDTWVLENSQIRMLWKINYCLERLRMFLHLPFRQQLAKMQGALQRLAPRNRSGESGWAHAYWPEKHFQSPHFRAPVLLFKRPRQPFYYMRDPEMGWGARSTGGVEICEVHCGHYQILRQPYVGGIAQKLSARLRGINEQSKGTTLVLPRTELMAQRGDRSTLRVHPAGV